MTVIRKSQRGARRCPYTLRAGGRTLALLALSLGCCESADCAQFKASGRVTFGLSERAEAADPYLLVSYNAAAMGLTGYASGGQNSDDADNNFRRGDVTSRVVKGYLDLALSQGSASALVRVKAWHDYALLNGARPWGNNANAYAANAPLSDQGAAPLSRFAGVALADAYLQDSFAVDGLRLFARAGRQSLDWGQYSAFGGGLSSVNAIDYSGLRRPGAAPQEMLVPQPMLFARVDRGDTGLAAEAWVQSGFRPAVLDMCGTFWASTDYLADGCDRAFVGSPAVSDRARLASGAFLKRMASPTPTDGAQFGLALTWKSATPGTELGLYHARYINRTPMPGLRKSERVPALIPGDPDGKNLMFFAEYPGGIDLYAVNALHRRGSWTWSGELAYRPKQPIQLPPGDVLPAFLNPAAPSPLRVDALQTAPGGLYHAYDRYRTMQLDASLRKDFGMLGRTSLAGTLELVAKHVAGLPDQALRRYGRADQYGPGPVDGVCTPAGPRPELQCSLDGYVSANAFAYRLRLDGRFASPLPGLELSGTVNFVHDVKGWSHDFQINQGRRTLNLSMRAEYAARYLAEITYATIWDGAYNNTVDRDQASVMVGVKF